MCPRLKKREHSMKHNTYFLKIIKGFRWKRFWNVLDRISKASGKNKVFLIFDILNCAIRYGAGYHDYLIFAFYNMNAHQRDTYMTRLRNKKLIALMNDPAYTEVFGSKSLFDQRFREYLHRDFLDLSNADPDSFAHFMADKDVIFAKPNVGESGKGIQKLSKADFASVEELYRYVTAPENNFGVIEQLLTQHPDVSAVYPLAINSFRIVTIVPDGVPRCVYAVAKFGNEGKFVDNMENSGLCCPIDQETGRIMGCAHTSALICYDEHPYTGVKLMGYQLPFVKEAVELAKKAALEVPQVRYVGWDVCITPDGPAIIEGNVYPGYDFWQLPEHTPDKIGLYPYYCSLVPELKR